MVTRTAPISTPWKLTGIGTGLSRRAEDPEAAFEALGAWSCFEEQVPGETRRRSILAALIFKKKTDNQDSPNFHSVEIDWYWDRKK